jgi:hypothetical protein
VETLSRTVAASAEALAVDPGLADLFPDQGLRRGTVLGVSGAGGAISLLLAVVSRALTEGSWAAVVGAPALGVEAAAGFGVRLDHLALIPDPGAHWTDVVGALLDALDLVVVSPPGRCRPADARRLAARTRDRHGVLVVVEQLSVGRMGRVERWPESVDLQLEAGAATWHGLDRGDGTLGGREVTVRSFGRRSGGRERSKRLWLPAGDGAFSPTGERQPESNPATGPAAGALAG